ncbi:hypothetical protein SE17_29560 [Kouleothrix aurantiaca]|uniref:Uncharacterized protein n=1 Tax=Kouleothrix aurantiaca TaxID=186479 RepID=A0A0P9FBM0_9CHLR|nr:hypothetical protein SE17_29560 [Kouleothrix aurantiaca]
MSQNNSAVLAALADVGITISPNPRAATGWGWAVSNEKISQPWVGPYATVDATISAALNWLMTRAWKGTLCIHTHSADADLSWRPEAERPAELILPPIDELINNVNNAVHDLALDMALTHLADEINALPDIDALFEAEDATPIDEALLAPWRKMFGE